MVSSKPFHVNHVLLIVPVEVFEPLKHWHRRDIEAWDCGLLEAAGDLL
jgi:hypothetical protein